MTANLEVLDWDSTFFEVPIGRVTLHECDEDLSGLLPQLISKNIKLLYLTTAEFIEPDGVLDSYRCSVSEERLIFVKQIAKRESSQKELVVANPGEFDQEVEALAVVSGGLSRFSRDPRIPTEKSQEMYRLWIRKQLRHDDAGEVLIVLENQKIAGMVSVSEDDGECVIGLVAVDEGFRGRGIGSRLLESVDQWCQLNGINSVRVATQGFNDAAIRLYKRSGYALFSRSFIYHLWAQRAEQPGLEGKGA